MTERREDIRRQEIYCHNCEKYVTFEVDMSLDGNHVFTCPCGHEHCRVVKDGRITGDRWDSRNGQTIQHTTHCNYTSSSMTYTVNSTSANYFIADAWCGTGTSNSW